MAKLEGWLKGLGEVSHQESKQYPVNRNLGTEWSQCGRRTMDVISLFGVYLWVSTDVPIAIGGLPVSFLRQLQQESEHDVACV